MLGEAWLTGSTKTSARLTWGGLAAAHTISSAISSAVTGRLVHEYASCCKGCIVLTRLQALVDLVSCCSIAPEPDNGEFSLNHAYKAFSPRFLNLPLLLLTRLNFGDPDRSVDELFHKRIGERADGVFCCAVDAASDIGFTAYARSQVCSTDIALQGLTGYGTKVDDMPRLLLLEPCSG